MIVVIGYEGTAKLDYAKKLISKSPHLVLDNDDIPTYNDDSVLVSTYYDSMKQEIDTLMEKGLVKHLHVVHQTRESIVENVIKNEKVSQGYLAKMIVEILDNYDSREYEILCAVSDASQKKIPCTQVYV